MSATSSKAQLARLLALVPYLQARGAVLLPEVAADFRVSPEQMLRDLRVLYMCGLPGFGPAELIDINVEALLDDPDGLVRIDNAEFLTRPLRLGSNEAVALIVALRALLDAGPEGAREVVERTLAKLEGATEPGALPLVAVHLPQSGPDAQAIRHELDRALANDRQVRLGYYVPTRDETTDRVVDPIAVLRRDSRTYLDAWCHLSDGRRLFRVDRIARAEVLPTQRETNDLTPRDLADGLFEPGPDAVLVDLLLAPGMWWFAEYYPVTSAVPTSDGGLRITLAVADARWLTRLALRFGHGLTVVGPPGMVERVRDAGRDALTLQLATAYDGENQHDNTRTE